MKNPQLKKAFSETSYTPENIEQLKRCMTDYIYFMNEFVKIEHPVNGLVNFNLYDYQIDMAKAIHENRKLVILCGRQLGKCVQKDTLLTTAIIPTGFRKFLLKFLDKKLSNFFYK